MMMKRMALAIGMALISTAASAQYAHEVQGYTRSDGTYVAQHMQTNPNGNAYDNYSSRPNVNPYTGQTGTVNPYEAQQRINANRAARSNCRSSYGC
jgi:hypothetical protein